MQELQKAVGRRIRELRKLKGLSQEQLAHESGLHRTYAGLIERGDRNVTLSILEKIASALDVTVADLFANTQLTSAPDKNRIQGKAPIPPSDTAAHLAVIRDVLIESNLVDVATYSKRLQRYRSGRKSSRSK